jgi:translation initiation factor IF-1
MSKEELIQFEGLVIEILPDARFRVQLDAGYEVVVCTAGKMKRFNRNADETVASETERFFYK